MNAFPTFAKLGALACAAVLLASCTVVVEEGYERPRPPRPGPDRACTMEYNPVCAERGGDRRTFGNACVANVEGYRIVHRGECRRGRPPQWSPPQQSRPPQACTREYNPVCARRGNRVRTFGNACEARVANYRVLHRGECR